MFPCVSPPSFFWHISYTNSRLHCCCPFDLWEGEENPTQMILVLFSGRLVMVGMGMCLPPTSPCPDAFSGTFFFSPCPLLELLLRFLTLKSGKKEEVRVHKLQNTAVCLNISRGWGTVCSIYCHPAGSCAWHLVPALFVGTDELSHTAWVRLKFLPVRRFSLSLCLDHSQFQTYCPAQWTWPRILRLVAEGQLLQPLWEVTQGGVAGHCRVRLLWGDQAFSPSSRIRTRNSRKLCKIVGSGWIKGSDSLWDCSSGVHLLDTAPLGCQGCMVLEDHKKISWLMNSSKGVKCNAQIWAYKATVLTAWKYFGVASLIAYPVLTFIWPHHCCSVLERRH